jgi:hypothetical protein
MGRVLADTSSVEDDDTGPRGSARRTLALAEVNGGGPGMAPRARRLLVWRGRGGPRTTSGLARAYSAAPDDSDSDSPIGQHCPPIIRQFCEQF